MEITLSIIGWLLIVLVILDFSFTAFVPTGEGKITSTIGKLFYHLFFFLARGKGDSGVLNYMGVATIFTIVMTWVMFIWAGFALILIADPASVHIFMSNTPADSWEKVYFAGYTISTLGVGDYTASTDYWRFITALMSLMGLILITMSISYIVPLISNVIHKRSLSLFILTMGESPEAIVINSYGGGGPELLNQEFSILTQQIISYSENHLAYPVLDKVHSTNRQSSTVLQIVSLDEALTIMLYVMSDEKSPATFKLHLARRAITSYLKDTRSRVQPTKDAPEWPDLDRVKKVLAQEKGFKSNEEIEEVYHKLKKRRALLQGLVNSRGWEWKDIYTEENGADLTF